MISARSNDLIRYEPPPISREGASVGLHIIIINRTEAMKQQANIPSGVKRQRSYAPGDDSFKWWQRRNAYWRDTVERSQKFHASLRGMLKCPQ